MATASVTPSKPRTVSLKTKSSKLAKPSVSVESRPSTEVVETPQPSVNVTESVSVSERSFKERMDTLIKSRREQIDMLRREVQELVRLQREHDVQLKNALKKNKKKGERDYTKVRRATGFAEPVLVSDELYSFLVKTKATMKDPSFSPRSKEEEANWPRLTVKAGVPIARTDVTAHINQYIKKHNLQNPNYRREIVPDAALKKLFSAPTELSDKSDPNSKKIYTYLHLQKYMNHHYIKKNSTTSA